VGLVRRCEYGCCSLADELAWGQRYLRYLKDGKSATWAWNLTNQDKTSGIHLDTLWRLHHQQDFFGLKHKDASEDLMNLLGWLNVRMVECWLQVLEAQE
jgi:hypothetical protein